MKTVKELIQELLEFDMESEVNLIIKYADVDDEVENFELGETHTYVGSNKIHIIVNFEDQNYHEHIALEEQ